MTTAYLVRLVRYKPVRLPLPWWWERADAAAGACRYEATSASRSAVVTVPGSMPSRAQRLASRLSARL